MRVRSHEIRAYNYSFDNFRFFFFFFFKYLRSTLFSATHPLTWFRLFSVFLSIEHTHSFSLRYTHVLPLFLTKRRPRNVTRVKRGSRRSEVYRVTYTFSTTCFEYVEYVEYIALKETTPIYNKYIWRFINVFEASTTQQRLSIENVKRPIRANTNDNQFIYLFLH